MKGKQMVISGTLMGSILLGIVLVMVTAGFSYAEVEGKGGEEIGNTGVIDQSEPEWNEECALGEEVPRKVKRWCGIIEEYSEKNNIPAELIAAVITQESGGKPGAYSSSGAVGLMQVMPRDGIAAGFMCVNGPCFRERPLRRELEDPEYNIKYGVKMLKRLKKQKGDWREALRAYGPRDVGYSYADKVLRIYERYRSGNIEGG